MSVFHTIFACLQAVGAIPENAIGQTWAIAEPDALEEVTAAAVGKSVSISDFGDSDRWAATQSIILPAAERDSIRDVIPFFTLPFDIPDGKGGVLYPAGFTFNPLEHLTLPNTLWIVRQEQLDWALDQAGAADMVIMSGGNALKESNARHTTIYALQDVLIKRLALKAAPSRVWQEGTALKIQEIDADRFIGYAPRRANSDAGDHPIDDGYDNTAVKPRGDVQ